MHKLVFVIVCLGESLFKKVKKEVELSNANIYEYAFRFPWHCSPLAWSCCGGCTTLLLVLSFVLVRVCVRVCCVCVCVYVCVCGTYCIRIAMGASLVDSASVG